ncbi:uncharacterized protein [Nicotiana sylvestris]|uniref:uncharacterized protein n=1 Tax=Nicotiana sylvestris TaxID=4096 RepID=UPI00388CA433
MSGVFVISVDVKMGCEVEEIEHGRNGEFKLMLECLLEGGNKEQNTLEELLKNSLQNDLALERLNSQMGEMLEALEVQKSSKVNDRQESSLEVEAENPSLALDQNQEELSNAQNEKMMLMLEAILENEEKQSLTLEDLKQGLTQNDEDIRTLKDQMKILVEAHYAHQLESVERSQEESDFEEESELYFEESRIEHPPTDFMSVSDAKKNMELESTGVNENLVEIDSSSGEKEDVKIREELQFGGLMSHSKHFSTLKLCGDMGIELHESIRDCEEERQGPCILQFEKTRRQNDIPHMKAKKCKMKKLMLGLIIYLPPPLLVVKSLIPS